MHTLIKSIGTGALGLILLGTAVTNAQVPAAPPTESDPNRVIIRVNGEDITAAELNFTANEVLPFLSNTPPQERVVIVTRTLIERHLLAQAARREGVIEAQSFKDFAKFYETKALYDSYLVEKITNKLNPDEVKKQFERDLEVSEAPERVRARHILLGTEQEAKDVLGKLQGGQNFEDLAKQFSLDGSKEFGGDLGYFTAQEMVPEFSQAAYSLKVGQISTPVKTEFGWHIIRLEDRKEGVLPSWEEVRQKYMQRARADSVQRALTFHAKRATVEILDPELKRLDQLAAANAKRLREEREKLRAQQNPGASEQQTPASSAKSGKGDLQ